MDNYTTVPIRMSPVEIRVVKPFLQMHPGSCVALTLSPRFKAETTALAPKGYAGLDLS